MESARIETLFAALVECSPTQRAARLAELEADEPTLATELRSLLAAADRAEGFLSHPHPHIGHETGSDFIGQHIGAYRIIRELGRGGMGAVFLAERADGQYHQQVALKLIRPGVHSNLYVQRFRAERQVLARLNHPYIARLLDGGSLDDGQPYLVMDYIEGEPLDRYCRSKELELADRLRLFAKVCEAVAHAHQRGVIHRDLKPTNILVTADGTPRLLDFGVAKLLADTETLTVTGRAPMTPGYAAPEQLKGETVTAATDVYALGLILYELLTDQRPFLEPAFRGPTTRVPPPSSQAATRYQRRQLKGDLDNIVRRALACSPEDRYDSAQALGDDILCHLVHRPVSASAHTLYYRLGKHLRHHRSAAAMSGLMALALLVGGIMVRSSDPRTDTTGNVTAVRSVTSSESHGTESPFTERCATLKERYLTSASKALFARLANCQLTDAEWHNSQGRYRTTLEILTALIELRQRTHRGHPPPGTGAQKERLISAFSQALAGIDDVDIARRYRRHLEMLGMQDASME